jgi:hypothetical protein
MQKLERYAELRHAVYVLWAKAATFTTITFVVEIYAITLVLPNRRKMTYDTMLIC